MAAASTRKKEAQREEEDHSVAKENARREQALAEVRQKEEKARKLADEKASQLAELKQKEEEEPQVRRGTMNVAATAAAAAARSMQKEEKQKKGEEKRRLANEEAKRAAAEQAEQLNQDPVECQRERELFEQKEQVKRERSEQKLREIEREDKERREREQHKEQLRQEKLIFRERFEQELHERYEREMKECEEEARREVEHEKMEKKQVRQERLEQQHNALEEKQRAQHAERLRRIRAEQERMEIQVKKVTKNSSSEGYHQSELTEQLERERLDAKRANEEAVMRALADQNLYAKHKQALADQRQKDAETRQLMAETEQLKKRLAMEKAHSSRKALLSSATEESHSSAVSTKIIHSSSAPEKIEAELLNFTKKASRRDLCSTEHKLHTEEVQRLADSNAKREQTMADRRQKDEEACLLMAEAKQRRLAMENTNSSRKDLLRAAVKETAVSSTPTNRASPNDGSTDAGAELMNFTRKSVTSNHALTQQKDIEEEDQRLAELNSKHKLALAKEQQKEDKARRLLAKAELLKKRLAQLPVNGINLGNATQAYASPSNANRPSLKNASENVEDELMNWVSKKHLTKPPSGSTRSLLEKSSICSDVTPPPQSRLSAAVGRDVTQKLTSTPNKLKRNPSKLSLAVAAAQRQRSTARPSAPASSLEKSPMRNRVIPSNLSKPR